MKLSSINNSVSFCATINENTRNIIKRYDRHCPEKFEEKFDKAIKESPLKDFGGNETTISVGVYSNSNSWGETSRIPAPVINTTINGKEISATLPGYGHDIEIEDEDDIIRHLQLKKYAQFDFFHILNNVNLDKIKTLLAQEYIKQSAQEMIENATSDTFDKINSGEIKFPNI